MNLSLNLNTAKSEREVIIGLEIHLQLNTQSKLFCTCSTNYQKDPNTNICEICTSQPGSKPMAVNKKAIEYVIKLAKALNAQVITDKKVYIQRKHYFYPDLPSNYQRTSLPIAVNGMLDNIRIREIHLEEDPGRYDIRTGLVEYNRCGNPLIEIVTEPDFKSAEQTKRFLEKLAILLDYLEITRREEGSMRVDANISLKGSNRVEIKNINSFRGVITALNYEITRQNTLLKQNLKVERETRHFDESQGITIGSRKKETVDDYRYIPDPDLVPIVISKELVEKIQLPELPEQKIERLQKEYNLKRLDAEILANDKNIANLFERLVKENIQIEVAVKWLNRDLRKQLNYRSISFAESNLKYENIKNILQMLQENKIHEKIAEQMLIDLLDKGKTEVKEKLADEEKISRIIEVVIKNNQKVVQDYKNGNEKAFNFLFGQVMKETKKLAEPKIVEKLLRERLNE